MTWMPRLVEASTITADATSADRWTTSRSRVMRALRAWGVSDFVFEAILATPATTGGHGEHEHRGLSSLLPCECSCESVSVGDGELAHRHAPFLGRSAPVGRDVPQCQPDQLGRRAIAREMATSLDALAQSSMHALDGVRRANQAAHCRSAGEERYKPVSEVP